jgi:uncharacterized protein YqfB (UPF0267 family)
MSRKTKVVAEQARIVALEAEKARKELDALSVKAREMEELSARAAEEEKMFLEETSLKLDNLCGEANVFCGVVLSFQDVVNILQLMIETRENVRIRYNLYFNE